MKMLLEFEKVKLNQIYPNQNVECKIVLQKFKANLIKWRTITSIQSKSYLRIKTLVLKKY